MNAIEKIEVHIVDGIEKQTPPLKFHCASRDDDLGWHYPHLGSDFTFSFRPSVFSETVFFCHFFWGSKDSAFEVYRDSGACGKEGIDTGTCYWLVKEDGFYFANCTSPSQDFLTRKSGW
uniref:S-protein homolog n=2 Tax=Solanum TaxID=4107 RepID=M1DEZ0_SOLTU